MADFIRVQVWNLISYFYEIFANYFFAFKIILYSNLHIEIIEDA